MDLFEMLAGRATKRAEYEQFANRYDQGRPWEGYSDEEVLDRYESLALNASAAD